MTKLTDWLRKAVVKLVDPEREERVKRVSNALFRAITQHGSRMVLSETLKNIECTETDLEIAKDRVLQRIVEKIWEDGAVTEKERRTVEKLADALEVSAEAMKTKILEFAKLHFAASLAAIQHLHRLRQFGDRRERRVAQQLRAAAVSLVGRRGTLWVRRRTAVPL